MNQPQPKPHKQPIDDVLWPRVSSLLWYIEMLVVIGLLVPLLIGTIIPFTPGWVTFYVIVVIACVSSGATVHKSRERLITWRSWVTSDGEERRRADAKHAKAKVDELIERDRKRGQL